MSEADSPVLTRSGHRAAPLSYAQERLWFIDAAAPGSATYNVPLLLRWTGPVDVAALRRALHAVVERHEVLRTTYHLEDGRPVQRVHDAAEPPVEVLDADGWERVSAMARERARLPFDLSAGPPLRCTVWRGEDAHAVLLSIHHIAIDGWSLAPLLEDLTRGYRAACAGERPQWTELPVQYTDFAAWDRATFATREARELLERRAEELAGLPTDLVLGSWRPAPSTPEGDRPGEQVVFALPPELWSAVAELARAARLTPFVVLLAAYQVVLNRWCGREEFAVGAVTVNRQHPDLERLVGFFVNTVPLRGVVRPEWTFRELCARVRTEAFGALTHQRIPYDRLSAELAGRYPGGRPNLVPIGFALQNMPAPDPADPPPWQAPELLPTGTAKFDLVLIVEENANGATGTIEYATDRYDAEVAHRFRDSYLAVLAAALADPDRPLRTLPMSRRAAGRAPACVVSGARRPLLAERMRGFGAPVPPDASLLDVLAARFAHGDPAAVAVRGAGRPATWAELDAWSATVAARLAEAGHGPGDIVPVICARGAGLAAAWLGALRSGAAYTPIGLDTPAHRVRHILADVGAKAVLVDPAGARSLAGVGVHLDVIDVEQVRGGTGTAPEVRLTGAEPAVVIYTSGTTGRPKGVLVPHRGMLNTVLWWADDTDLGPADRVLCTWSTSFDGATHEAFRALVGGAELVFADDDERRDPRAIARLLREVTVTSMTPTLLRAVLDADPGGRTGLRTLYVGGEALSRQLAQECTRRWGVPIRNIYGPTEGSCISTVAPVDPDDAAQPAIGVPLPNTRAYVLGPHGEELPAGVPGELSIAGIGVALGYLGQPERTEDAFVPDPWADEPDARVYRTGDRVVLHPGGYLEHLGRVDDQVKILGYRIEPDEVRKLLEEQPAVRSAAVAPVGDPPRLVAYVVLDGDRTPSRDELVAPLLHWLPAAALPSEVYAVPELPVTGNDKVDFAALAGAATVRLPEAPDRRAELTGDERRAAELFAEVLGEKVALGPDSSFFAVGGHSLLAVAMLGGAERRGWGRIPLRDFLADPTVAGLARLLTAIPAATASLPTTASPAATASLPTTAAPAATVAHSTVDGGRFPASAIQQRFWLLDRLPTVRTAYLAPAVVRLRGTVDVPALRDATVAVLARHPALRSRFALDRRERLVYYRTDGAPPEVTVTDARGWSAGAGRERVAHACWAPVDLANAASARAELVVTDDATLLVLVAHHIVMDGISQAVLLDEIGTAYRTGRAPQTPPVHPARVPAPEREALDASLARTLERLRGAPTDVALPYDRPRTGTQSVEAAAVTVPLDPGLRARAAELDASTFMVAAALVAVTLARLGNQREFLLAYPWAGREAPGTEGAVGMFVNTLLLRVDCTGDPSWRTLVGRVRADGLAGYRDADVPFDEVAAALQPERDLGRPPLTPVFLSALSAPPAPPDLGVDASFIPLDPLYAKYELELSIVDRVYHTEGTGRLELTAAYATALFDAGTATDLLRRVAAAAGELATDPDTHPLHDPDTHPLHDPDTHPFHKEAQ